MSSTSTVVTVKKQLVSQLGAVLTVPTFYAWPGKETPSECVFLGPHPEIADIRIDGSSQIPTIKAGRKRRDETYAVRVTVWTFRPELTVENAESCEKRAFEFYAAIEDVLADDPRIGLAASLVPSGMYVSSIASTLFPFQAGWACELAVDVTVEARLV